jgi:hypothetical protein
MATLQDFIDSTNLPPELVRAVVEQSGGWEDFTESAPDMARSIDGGFSGFIYYSDTVPFAEENRAGIARVCEDIAEDFGQGVIEMVQGFNCFRNDPPSQGSVGRALYGGAADDDTRNVLNALAWFAGESVARAFVDFVEG